MELRGTPFKVGNDRYDYREITIESNFLNVKEIKLLEGLALIMGAYYYCPELIAKAVKERCVEMLDSMRSDGDFWGDVYDKEMLEDRINYYREVISELESLIACL